MQFQLSESNVLCQLKEDSLYNIETKLNVTIFLNHLIRQHTVTTINYNLFVSRICFVTAFKNYIAVLVQSQIICVIGLSYPFTAHLLHCPSSSFARALKVLTQDGKINFLFFRTFTYFGVQCLWLSNRIKSTLENIRLKDE